MEGPDHRCFLQMEDHTVQALSIELKAGGSTEILRRASSPRFSSPASVFGIPGLTKELSCSNFLEKFPYAAYGLPPGKEDGVKVGK